MIKNAVISDCGRYRYELSRTWDNQKPCICWILLNPSTADADKDDPTIRKLIGFSERLGAGSLVVVNLFAWRATDPKEMFKAQDPVGPENDEHIIAACLDNRVIVAWGRTTGRPLVRERAGHVMRMFKNRLLWALRLTQNGDPMHPLYIPYDRVNKDLERWPQRGWA